MTERKGVKKSANSTTVTARASKAFTDEERLAMRERVEEQRRGAGKADEESDVLAKIAELPAADRAMAKRLLALIKASAPALSPKLWYGMPAYATQDGKIVCHFQSAKKFNTRYATLRFSDKANLGEGGMWPVAFALKDLTPAEEAGIGALVKKAVR